jgi:hypothetical protein
MKPVLSKMFASKSLSDRDIDYMLEYQLAAGFGVIAKWFHAQDMTDQEIIRLLVDCSQTGVVNLLSSEHTATDVVQEQDNIIIDQIISELEDQKEE